MCIFNPRILGKINFFLILRFLSKPNPNSIKNDFKQLGFRLDIVTTWNPPPHTTQPLSLIDMLGI